MSNGESLESRPSAGPGERKGAAFDLVLVLGTLLAIKYALLQFNGLWTYAGPISLLAALAAASWCLHNRSQKWADLGLKVPESARKLMLWSSAALILTLAAGILVDLFITSAVGSQAGEIDPRYRDRFVDVPGNTKLYLYWIAVSCFPRYRDRFVDVPGNTKLYLYWIAVSWVVGAFAEEMLFRGMLISRFEQLLSKFKYAPLIAVILQSVIFGQQHFYYQGWSGALATGAIALVSGALYLLMKRNLWPLILSHGMANMLGLTLIYAGIQPPG